MLNPEFEEELIAVTINGNFRRVRTLVTPLARQVTALWELAAELDAESGDTPVSAARKALSVEMLNRLRTAAGPARCTVKSPGDINARCEYSTGHPRVTRESTHGDGGRLYDHGAPARGIYWNEK